MTDVALRPFTAVVSYPGKKPFMVGTFFAREGDKDHDMDAVVLAEVNRFWSDHMPEGIAPPKIEKTVWGSIFFVPEGDAPASQERSLA